MKLINKLTPEHLEKLKNLENSYRKAGITEELQKEYVFELTIGGALDFCLYILDIPFDYITLHEYFNTKK